MVELGFHQLAWSMMRALGWCQGPRGGWDQRYPIIGARWNRRHVSNKVAAISQRLGGGAKTKITCGDFEPLIEDTSRHALLLSSRASRSWSPSSMS
jgi:hypothetical protein